MTNLTLAQQRAIALMKGKRKPGYTYSDFIEMWISLRTVRALVRRGILIELPSPRGSYWYTLSNEYTNTNDAAVMAQPYTCPTCFGSGCAACDDGRITDTDPARSDS